MQYATCLFGSSWTRVGVPSADSHDPEKMNGIEMRAKRHAYV